MKKKVKRLSVVALAVVTLAVLTGCGTEKVSRHLKIRKFMWLLYWVLMLIRRV